MVNKILSEVLIEDSLPSLLSVHNQYHSLACSRNISSLQALLLGELQRRINNVSTLLQSIVELANTSSALHFQSLISQIKLDPNSQIEFKNACILQDQLWMLSETFYWNCARCISVLYGKGLSNKLEDDSFLLPGLSNATKPFINVAYVRHKLIEHPEVYGGSLAIGASTSGPLIGERGNGDAPCDMGLYANAVEFIDVVSKRLESAVFDSAVISSQIIHRKNRET